MTTETQILKLARMFSSTLRDWLTKTEMKTVIARNAAEKDPNVCHTQDFCDANMAMADAFEKLFGREPDTGTDADSFAWNRAWDRAKRTNFDV